MAIDCAACSGQVCETGHVEAVPENCPMITEFPDFNELYSSKLWRRMARQAAIVEAEGYGRWSRLREIAELASRMDYQRVGIAHCPDTAREARLTARYFETHHLDPVLPRDCRDCEPSNQAKLFESEKTHFNVITGMCVGHDSIFIRASSAPVTSFVVRDSKLRHNPVGALYTSNSYFRRGLYLEHRDRQPVSFRGSGDPALDSVARAVVEDGHGEWSRVEEVIELSGRLGIERVGIVFCSGFQLEARLLTRVFRANGFAVRSSCCKTGSVPKEELGILDSQKVRPGTREMMCNPLAQAELLNKENVQLALLLGQCAGHDSATMAHLEAPAVCMVAKDRSLAHNTVAALYELED
jgi:uncharacterized metal-binding protein